MSEPGDDHRSYFTRWQWWGWSASLSLTLVRLALAPLVVLLLAMPLPRWTFAALLVIGFLSDVFDGIVARRFGVATSMLRRLDSAVDIVFYLALAFAAWRLETDAIRHVRWGVAGIIVGEALNHVLAVRKFGREPSYHAYSAKCWGLLLFLSLLLLLGAGNAALLPLAIAAGLVAQVEVLAITIVLPAWRHDVRTVWHASRHAGRSGTAD